jgi:hypothetical protein
MSTDGVAAKSYMDHLSPSRGLFFFLHFCSESGYLRPYSLWGSLKRNSNSNAGMQSHLCPGATCLFSSIVRTLLEHRWHKHVRDGPFVLSKNNVQMQGRKFTPIPSTSLCSLAASHVFLLLDSYYFWHLRFFPLILLRNAAIHDCGPWHVCRNVHVWNTV